MAGSAFEIVSTSISSVLGFFTDLLDATGLTPVYLSLFTLLIVVSFLVAPILGTAGGSDSARKKDKGKDQKGG